MSLLRDSWQLFLFNKNLGGSPLKDTKPVLVKKTTVNSQSHIAHTWWQIGISLLILIHLSIAFT